MSNLFVATDPPVPADPSVASSEIASGIAEPEVAPERSSGPTPSDPPVPLLPESPRGSFLWRLRGVIRTMRPSQWVKNTFVLAPIVFAKQLGDPKLIISAVGAVNIATSSDVYFDSDSVGLRATWRVGHAVVRPNRIGKFTVEGSGS